MSRSKHRQVIEFSFEGRFLHFLSKKDHKPKSLGLATSEGEYRIKLSSKLRTSIDQVLAPGDWVQVSGKKKLNLKTGKFKMKASRVKPTAPRYAERFPQPEAKSAEPKKILVCQKSPCIKRGSQAAYQALETVLGDRGLEDQVSLKITGCMNRCKAGPNVVFMPGRNRYTQVHPEEIPALVEKHFPAQDGKGNTPETLLD